MIKEPFEISFERSGGFTGMVTRSEVSSKSLDLESLQKLKNLLNESGLLSFPEGEGQTGNKPDSFQYRIVLKQPEADKTWILANEDLGEKMRALVEFLRQLARKR